SPARCCGSMRPTRSPGITMPNPARCWRPAARASSLRAAPARCASLRCNVPAASRSVPSTISTHGPSCASHDEDRHPRAGRQRTGRHRLARRLAARGDGALRAKAGDPRDRALLMALLSEGARWWLRFDAAIDGLLENSLRHKDPAVHALLVLGLVQLEILELQDYAAVAATVEAVRALKRPQLAGLVNAVLRRWQRERESLLAKLDGKPQTRHAH